MVIAVKDKTALVAELKMRESRDTGAQCTGSTIMNGLFLF